MMKAILALLLLPLLALHAGESEPPEGSRAAQPARLLWSAQEKEFTLPLEGDPTQKEIVIPPLTPDREKRVALRFRARFHWPKVGGIAPHLGLLLNGQRLDPDFATILNRGDFETSIEGYAATPPGSGWWRGGPNWRLILHYSPTPHELEPRILSDREEGQWYLIAIDDYFLPGQPNTLTMINFAIESNWSDGTLHDTTGIVIEHLALVEL